MVSGAFRTDWSGRSMRETQHTIADYDATVGARRELIRSMDGRQPGDPRKLGDAVVMLAGLDDPPPRLPLGRDVFETYREKLRELSELLDGWEAVGGDMDLAD